MFYIRFETKNGAALRKDIPSDAVHYVGIPQQYVGRSCYYHIYENGHPLVGMHFATRREARSVSKRLKMNYGKLLRAGIELKVRFLRTSRLAVLLGFEKFIATVHPSV